MSTYSEHIKNAQHEIDGVHEWQEREGGTDATMLASAGIAQAEATLALAEQQRIANALKRAEILAVLSPYAPAAGFEATEALYDKHEDWRDPYGRVYSTDLVQKMVSKRGYEVVYVGGQK